MSWEEVLKAIDDAFEQLKVLMDQDPRHGILYQQRMAVLMAYEQQVLAEINSDSNCRTIC